MKHCTGRTRQQYLLIVTDFVLYFWNVPIIYNFPVTTRKWCNYNICLEGYTKSCTASNTCRLYTISKQIIQRKRSDLVESLCPQMPVPAHIKNTYTFVRWKQRESTSPKIKHSPIKFDTRFPQSVPWNFEIFGFETETPKFQNSWI